MVHDKNVRKFAGRLELTLGELKQQRRQEIKILFRSPLQTTRNLIHISKQITQTEVALYLPHITL